MVGLGKKKKVATAGRVVRNTSFKRGNKMKKIIVFIVFVAVAGAAQISKSEVKKESLIMKEKTLKETTLKKKKVYPRGNIATH